MRRRRPSTQRRPGVNRNGRRRGNKKNEGQKREKICRPAGRRRRTVAPADELGLSNPLQAKLETIERMEENRVDRRIRYGKTIRRVSRIFSRSAKIDNYFLLLRLYSARYPFQGQRTRMVLRYLRTLSSYASDENFSK